MPVRARIHCQGLLENKYYLGINAKESDKNAEFLVTVVGRIGIWEIGIKSLVGRGRYVLLDIVLGGRPAGRPLDANFASDVPTRGQETPTVSNEPFVADGVGWRAGRLFVSKSCDRRTWRR